MDDDHEQQYYDGWVLVGEEQEQEQVSMGLLPVVVVPVEQFL